MLVVQQVFTLAGTTLGAVLALLAPMTTSALSRRDKDRDVQRGTAADIMALFDDGASPTAVFTGRQSPPRRRLYLLALRLQDAAAREACMRFIASAGQSPVDEDALMEAWESMMDRIGSVYRRGRQAVS
ncbi:hypothetical protein ABH920_006372 [Catenulispora sp. EB89]|uniref:hypothetical protein n=1 Tax=Catenulispora sp. EB89 TaxID=3156257 RepID=UPI0035181458